MRAPAAQQVFGIQQDIHAFGEEQRNHVRIASFTSIVVLTGAGFHQPCLMQGMNLEQKLGGTFDRRQRLMVEIGQPVA